MFNLLSLLALSLLPRAIFAASQTNASSLPQDDETALIQHTLHMNHRELASPAAGQHPRSSRSPPAQGLVQRLQNLSKFDCSAHPRLCQPPFDCHEVSPEDVNLWLKKGAASRGAPNYKLWCSLPHYESYASSCASGDLDGAGRLQFQLTTAGAYGLHTKELDGSACFLEGHCLNRKVTNETTAQDAASLCDERFGREAWASWGREAMPAWDRLDYSVPADASKGYRNRLQTRPSQLAACAMGNFHCDVWYCQQNYCKDKYYVEKYGGLLEAFGWTKPGSSNDISALAK